MACLTTSARMTVLTLNLRAFAVLARRCCLFTLVSIERPACQATARFVVSLIAKTGRPMKREIWISRYPLATGKFVTLELT